MREYELELNLLNEQKSSDKKVKSITFKTVVSKKKLVRMNMMNVFFQKHEPTDQEIWESFKKKEQRQKMFHRKGTIP